MFELLHEFLLELIRALLMEELSSRVHNGVAGLIERRKRRRSISSASMITTMAGMARMLADGQRRMGGRTVEPDRNKTGLSG